MNHGVGGSPGNPLSNFIFLALALFYSVNLCFKQATKFQYKELLSKTESRLRYF